MRVNSTGLGATTMTADFEGFYTTQTDKKLKTQYEGKNGAYIIMGIEAVKPVHWTIRCALDGKDLRKLVLQGLNPKVIFRILSILVRGTKLD